MIDVSRLFGMLGGLVEQASQFAPEGLMQQISELGFDPAKLQELGLDDLLGQLSSQGFDLSALDSGQLSELVGQLGEGVSPADIIGKLTSGGDSA